jgi:hypothetical protein
MIFRKIFVALALSSALFPPASAADLPVFKSAERPPHLLEVYTSEGCSSCPPADLWLGELRSEPNLWKDFIPVAFHVDYWDQLGWKDRLGGRKFTIRQRQEAEAGRVYTPGFFLNGREWRGWFENQAMPPADAPATGVLTVTEVRPLEFVVDFRPKDAEKGPLEANAALLAMGLHVTPTAGENRGQALTHDFTAVGFRTTALSPSGGRFTATVKLSNDTPVDAPSLAAAFWVTRPSSFVPLQAVGGTLGRR